MPGTQSGYCQFHSIETAVTKVYNDLLLAVDDGDVSARCLLDLTAAFDTVDHDLLMLRLERQFGLRSVVLQWFRSYLTGRTFQVIYADRKSSMVIICCSVPQGSVLGPRMFILYMADLEDTVAAQDARLHAYTDDTQLNLKCHTQEATTAAAHTLQACITDVTAWMNMNTLKLNADKTELLWAGSKYGSALLGSSGPSLQLGAETIKASDHVRLLGVTISSDLSLDKHFLLYVQRASIGSVRSADYVDHSTQTPQLLLYTLSLRLVSTTVTRCWLGCQGPSPTGFNG